MDPATPAPPRDWEMLAAWLRAEWTETSASAHPIQRGIYEGYAAVASIMQNSSPEERESCLYHFLMEALTAGCEAVETA